MPILTRRKVIAGAAASAASTLAACTSTNPNPVIRATALPAQEPLASQDFGSSIDPKFSEIYAEVKGEPFPVPAIKLSQINPAFLRRNVGYATKEPPGTIIVDPANHYLYHVEAGGMTTRYGVGVGREGFVWAGNATINSKQEWPDWYPPKEMIARKPELKKSLSQLQSGVGMHGGAGNPLGARAMYLW